MRYSNLLVNLWKTDIAANADFGAFAPVESEGCLHIAAVVDAAVVLTLRTYRDKGEPEETYVDMVLNAGDALTPGALFQVELQGVIIPVEECALRVSGVCKVEKLSVIEVK